MSVPTFRLATPLLAFAIVISLPQHGAAQPSVREKPTAKPTAEQASGINRKIASRRGSRCRGLAKPDCQGIAICGWITPKKKTDKRGRRLTAHCRKTARSRTTRNTTAKSAVRSQK